MFAMSIDDANHNQLESGGGGGGGGAATATAKHAMELALSGPHV